MGCKVSKSADTVASISRDEQKAETNEAGRRSGHGDHGSLMSGSLTQKKTSAPPAKGREAFSPGGSSRPVPRARTFLEETDEPASDPAKLRELENSADMPILGQPGYLAHSRSSQQGRGSAGGGGGSHMTTEIEELQEDWDAALGRRSGTKASLSAASSRPLRSPPSTRFISRPPPLSVLVGVTSLLFARVGHFFGSPIHRFNSLDSAHLSRSRSRNMSSDSYTFPSLVCFCSLADGAGGTRAADAARGLELAPGHAGPRRARQRSTKNQKEKEG
jgi:hypothetical protein